MGKNEPSALSVIDQRILIKFIATQHKELLKKTPPKAYEWDFRKVKPKQTN